MDGRGNVRITLASGEDDARKGVACRGTEAGRDVGALDEKEFHSSRPCREWNIEFSSNKRGGSMSATAVQTVAVLETEIADLKMIVPRIHRDHRGFFSETYSKVGLSALGVNLEFVQDNHSLSVERGV